MLTRTIELEFETLNQYYLIAKTFEYGHFLHEIVRYNQPFTKLFSEMGNKVVTYEGDRIQDFEELIAKPEPARHNPVKILVFLVISIAVILCLVKTFAGEDNSGGGKSKGRGKVGGRKKMIQMKVISDPSKQL